MRRASSLVLIVAVWGCGEDTGDAGDRVDDGGVAVADAGVWEELPPPEHLWFKLNSDDGETMWDASANEAHATLTATYRWTGSAVAFEATDSGAETPPLPGSYRSLPHTISAWVTPEARADRTANEFAQVPFPTNCVSNDIPTLDGFGFGINVWTDGGGGSAMRLGAHGNVPDLTFEAGTRYHVVVVYAADGITLYLDGEGVYTAGPAVALVEQPSPVYIGRHNNDANYGTKRFFLGEIDDVRVYQRALDAADAAQLYARGPA